MHIYIVGICGTFMTGIACIARELGFTVSGCDENIYPPMSGVLKSKNISIDKGYNIPKIESVIDIYVIGNAAKRGMPIIEDILTNKKKFKSGPQWLYENVLYKKQVVAIAGTHGKTTTSSLLAWVLEFCGHNPSFLIGGVPANFDCSARVTDSDYFVIEADEYDTAFFDKRSKMVHYRPDVAVINNLEFDHIDIFNDLSDIQKQFHGMVRQMSQQALIVFPSKVKAIDDLLAMGSWSNLIAVNDCQGLHANLLSADGSHFQVKKHNKILANIEWNLIGQHNVDNAMSVIAVCLWLKLPLEQVEQALKLFKSVKRRLEMKKNINGVKIYDDFAHHPTAIASTVDGLRNNIVNEKLVAILDFGSHTMRSGLFFDEILNSLQKADYIYLLNTPNKTALLASNYFICDSINNLCVHLNKLDNFQHILVMSNRSNQQLLKQLNLLLEKRR